MKIERILLGRAIRFIDDVREVKKEFSIYDVTRAIQERYKFIEAPSKLADYNFSNGVTYLLGRFKDHRIQRFQIYQYGLLCDAEASTDVCEEFLDDLTRWIEKDFEQLGREKPSSRLYMSNLELHSKIDLNATLSKVMAAGQMFGDMLQSYGQSAQDLHAQGFKIMAGPVSDIAAFSFERRAHRPLAEKIYFSSANLRTSDHKKLLDYMETIFVQD